MKDIIQKLAEQFAKHRFSVLATIIKQAGPTPRGIGTKCLILDDGSLVGTIGGGILEAQTVDEARKVFDSQLPIRLEFSLKGLDVADTDMLCGGDVEVFLEPVSPKNQTHLSILERAAQAADHGKAGLLATVIDSDQWRHGNIPKLFMEKSAPTTGSWAGSRHVEKALSGEMEKILGSGQPTLLSLKDEAGNPVQTFVEPVVSDAVLYIFGAGHVSRQVVPFAARVGFQVVVVDDRPEFADIRAFPAAREVLQMSLDDAVEKLPILESSFLVIVTRGHIHDKMVLAQALRTNARYIGMIGSTRKRDIIYKQLFEEGFSEADLARVHSPIGLAIGAETPQEIAVSIVAELIQVRAEKA
jgi:xanthine dehydrogenase accessory factor